MYRFLNSPVSARNQSPLSTHTKVYDTGAVPGWLNRPSFQKQFHCQKGYHLPSFSQKVQFALPWPWSGSCPVHYLIWANQGVSSHPLRLCLAIEPSKMSKSPHGPSIFLSANCFLSTMPVRMLSSIQSVQPFRIFKVLYNMPTSQRHQRAAVGACNSNRMAPTLQMFYVVPHVI